MPSLPTSDPDITPALTSPHETRARLRRAWMIGRPIITLILLIAGIWVIAGKSNELSGASSFLDHLSWPWLVFAGVSESLSYVTYAVLQRRLLSAGGVRAPLPRMTGITLASNSLINALPAGGLVAATFTFRQFRRFGADDLLSGWVVVATIAVGMITLALTATFGLVFAVGAGSTYDLVWVIVGVAATALAIVAAWSYRSYLFSPLLLATRALKHVIRRPRGNPETAIRDLLDRIGSVAPSRNDWFTASTMGLATWLTDCGCLALAFASVGVGVPWQGLLLAYSGAQLATNLPITPGGLGVVEGSLALALVAFGGAQNSTVAAVLIYRIISFWIPLPAGIGTYLLLHRRSRAKLGEPIAVRNDMDFKEQNR